MQYLGKHKDYFKSSYLRRLLTVRRAESEEAMEGSESDGLLPDLKKHLLEFEEYIAWQDSTPKPREGLVESYDLLESELRRAKAGIEEYLESLRRATGIASLKYVHTKERY